MENSDVFISSKGLSAIIHYRPETNKVINFIKGPFYINDVNIIDDSKISIFNNNNTLKENSKYSEVIIYDFEKIFTKKFNDQLISNNFKTPTSGISRILNDGSLYVEEQKHGRILFFNPNGELEWEYINKDMKGDIYGINWSRVIENKKYKQSLLDLIKKKIVNKSFKMKKKILVSCVDAGGANIINHWIKKKNDHFFFLFKRTGKKF